jgi:hypothetical protein
MYVGPELGFSRVIRAPSLRAFAKRNMYANATSLWFFSGTCIDCQKYDIQNLPIGTITSLCGFVGVLTLKTFLTTNM